MAQPTEEFYQGLGYLSFAFAMIDGNIEPDEARTFTKGMLKSFGNMPEDKRGKAAINAFMEARAFQHSPEKAYVEALRIFMEHKYDFKKHNDKLLGIMQDIIETDDIITREEQELIDRFQADVDRMLEEIAVWEKEQGIESID